MMRWQMLANTPQVESIIERSFEKPQIIFKHSTRCSISSTIKSRLERQWDLAEDQVDAHYLDLISYREVSNHIEDKFQIRHESPQLILIQNGQPVYHASHFSIQMQEVKVNLEAPSN